jgi:Fic/DOC family
VPIAWNSDPPGSDGRIIANLKKIGAKIIGDAALRLPPSVAMAQEWHRAVYQGVTLLVSYYAGETRDTDPAYPELIGYEVSVGTALGVPSTDVPVELNRLEAGLLAIVARMDAVVPFGRGPSDIADLHAVLRIAAIAHGEWVRIHPFANGNGRIARLWANWVAVRYGLPFFLSLRPRPSSLIYSAAAAASMRGDHRPMEAALLSLLSQHVV